MKKKIANFSTRKNSSAQSILSHKIIKKTKTIYKES